MMKKIQKYIVIITMLIITIGISTKVKAAGIGMSINKTSAYVGDTFSVTISGINGKVSISGNSNISLSTSGTKWVEGSLTITGTAKSVGTGTVTVTAIDVSSTGADPVEVTGSASKSITIKQKEEPKPQETAPQTKPQTTTTTKPKTTTTNKTTTKTQDKKETKQEVKQEEKKEEVKEEIYITKLALKGIKENGEKIDITLSPEFNKDTYEYTFNIAKDIKTIEVEKEAGTNQVTITGLDEIKEGENIILIKVTGANGGSKTYLVKAVKEKEEIIETVAEEENKEEKKQIMVSMPLWVFIIMQIGIIVVEVGIIWFIFMRKYK